MIITNPAPGWAAPLHADLLPGAHVVVLGGPDDGIEARGIGFEIRDTILVAGDRACIAFVLRKSLTEGTVVAQVLTTGTGAFDIDSRRIYSGPSDGGSISGASALGQGSGWNRHNNRTTQIDRSMPEGRWPPNTVLVHGTGCRRAGTKRVKPGNGSGRASAGGDADRMGYGEWAGTMRGGGFVDDDGTEEVSAWACEPGCPVEVLDEQSSQRGMHLAGNRRPMNHQVGNKVYAGGWTPISNNPDYYGDAGGASRFYPQFAAWPGLIGWLGGIAGCTIAGEGV